MSVVSYRFKLRRGKTAAWEAANPVLLAGEPGLDTTLGIVKYGDGVSAWLDLPYSTIGAEGIQDVVGAMIVAAGGAYDDEAGTITLPSSGGGGVELVSGVVDLTSGGSPVREFYCTASATIEGVAFPAGTAVVFRRTPAGVWGYIVVDPWTDISGTTTTTTTAATTTTTTTAATTTTTTTAATTTTTTTAATTTTTTTAAPTTTTTTTSAVWASDDFARANSTTSLGTAPTGQAWQYVAITGATPVFGIHDGSAYKVSPTINRSTAIVTGLASANMDVRGTIVAYQGSAYYPGLAARVAAGEGYVLEMTSGFNFQVQRIISGTATALNSPTAVTGGWLNKEFRLIVAEEGSDTRVTVFCDGVQLFTGLDMAATRPMSATAGICIYGTDVLTKVDNFSVRPAA